MSLARGVSSVLVVVASLAGLAVHAGCSDGDAGGASSGGPGAGLPEAAADAADGGPRTLDAGGEVVAPFTCARDSIQGEPRPAGIVLEQLRAAAGLDVLEERFVLETTESDAGTGPEPARAGTPCANAADRATCEAAFAALSSGGEVLRPAFDEVDYMAAFFAKGKASGHYLAYTKGDTVGKVSNQSELHALFPTVDTPAKALLYANAAGYRVECHRAEGWIREEADGWVIVASRGHEARCTRTDVLLWLKRDGTTEERDVIEDQQDACT